jgi:hypothetical protein
MTSKAYVLTETSIKVNGEAGADVALSAEGVLDGAGRVSTQKDWGSGARAYQYDWSCEVLFQATPTQYGTLNIYLATAPDNDPTQISGDVGATDAALGDLDQLKNLQFIGSVIAEEADTTKMVGSGEFESSKRYQSYVIHNDSGAAINATDSNFILTITPKAIQGQAT